MEPQPTRKTQIYTEDLHQLWAEFFNQCKDNSNIERQILLHEGNTENVKWAKYFSLRTPRGEENGDMLTYQALVDLALTPRSDRNLNLFSVLQYEMIMDFYLNCVSRRYVAKEKSRKDDVAMKGIVSDLFNFHQLILLLVFTLFVCFLSKNKIDLLIIFFDFLSFGVLYGSIRYKPKDIFKHMFIFELVYFVGNLYTFPNTCPSDNMVACFIGLTTFTIASFSAMAFSFMSYLKYKFRTKRWKKLKYDFFPGFFILIYGLSIVIQAVGSRLINDEDFMKIDV